MSKTSDEREQLGDSAGPPPAPPGVEPPPYHKEDEKQPGLLAVLRETVVLVALAVLLAVVFKTFLVAAFYIPSGSMESTLNISDRVLVEKVSYRFGDIERGDVIVFVHDEPGVEVPRPSNPVAGFFSSLGQAIGVVPPSDRDFIKRVIGLPGDTITCRGGKLIRNGQPVKELYLDPGTQTDELHADHRRPRPAVRDGRQPRQLPGLPRLRADPGIGRGRAGVRAHLAAQPHRLAPAGPLTPAAVRLLPMFPTATALFEDRLRDAGFGRVAGVDEAGRGALAGPLVAAAVILPRDCPIQGLADSKLLTPQRRRSLAAQIHDHALAVAVVRIGPDTIDRVGLQRANIALLARALRDLEGGYDYALADGFPLPRMPAPVLGVKKGDQVATCVAAASIIAKVTRDKIMTGAARRYRGYGFQRHKGYGTDEHWAALRRLGPSAYHRHSFTGVAAPWATGHPAVTNDQEEGEECR